MAEKLAVTEGAEQMPGYWRFVWMFFMQPLTLHERLKACGIAEPEIRGWNWWRRRGLWIRFIRIWGKHRRL